MREPFAASSSDPGAIEGGRSVAPGARRVAEAFRQPRRQGLHHEDARRLRRLACRSRARRRASRLPPPPSPQRSSRRPAYGVSTAVRDDHDGRAGGGATSRRRRPASCSAGCGITLSRKSQSSSDCPAMPPPPRQPPTRWTSPSIAAELQVDAASASSATASAVGAGRRRGCRRRGRHAGRAAPRRCRPRAPSRPPRQRAATASPDALVAPATSRPAVAGDGGLPRCVAVLTGDCRAVASMTAAIFLSSAS